MDAFFDQIFGLTETASDLVWAHYVARAALVFVVGVFVIRLQNRFVGISTPFTYLLNVALGSLLASAITTERTYFPILGMVLFLSMANWLLALLSLRFSIIDRIIRGREDTLVTQGRIIWENMRKHMISRELLLEVIFETTGIRDISKIEKAVFVTGTGIVVKEYAQ